MLPPIVVMLESPHFATRVAEVRTHYPDLEKIVVIVRSANPPTMPTDVSKIEIHRVNEYVPPTGRRIKLITEPSNPVESIRQVALWARRYPNNIEFLIPTAHGSFESAAQLD